MATIHGNNADNVLYGGQSFPFNDHEDVIYAYGGNDYVSAKGDDDTVYGGDGRRSDLWWRGPGQAVRRK